MSSTSIVVEIDSHVEEPLLGATLNVAEMWDESKLCALARRVPLAKKTGNTLQDAAAMHERQHLVHWVDTLFKNRHLITTMHSHMIMLLKDQVQTPSEDCFKALSTLGRLDEDFLISWFTAVGGLNAQDLSLAKLNDPLFFTHLLVFAVQVPASTKLPPAMKNKAVAFATLSRRHEQVGNRLLKLKNCFDAEKRFKWSNGAYRFVFDNGVAKSVTHSAGATVELPPYVHINAEFVLETNYCDATARATLGGASYLLCNFFGANVGPNSYPRWSPRSTLISDLAKIEQAKVLEAKRAVAVGSSSGSSVTTLEQASKCKKQEAAKRARAVMQEKSESLKRQRRVALSL